MLFLDFSTDYQLFFQDSASPMMNGIVDLHHYVMMFLFFILTFVLTMLLVIFNLFVFKNTVRKLTHKHFNHNRDIESRLLRMPLVRHTVLNMHKKRISRNSTDISLYRVLANMNYFNNIKDELNYRAAGTNLASLILPGFKNILLINNLNNKFNCLISLNSKNVNEQNYNFFKNISTKVDFSKYITFFYLNSNDFSVRLPKSTLNKAQSQIKSASWESLAVTSVFPSYILNLYYWMQTYYTLKSGIYNFTHSTVIEIVWTVLPSLVLVFIGVPSFILLYAMDEIIEPDLVIKCIGHQWYWSYETGLNIFDIPEYARDCNNCYVQAIEPFYDCYTRKGESIYYEILNLMGLEAEEHGIHVNGKDVFFDFDDSLNVFANLVLDENGDLNSHLSNNYNFLNHRDLSLEPLKDLLPILDNYPNFLNKAPYISFDSYMVDEKDLELGTPRLLEVDNPLVLPVQTHIDLLVTSNDVIHCWTVPSFGIKMDAVPGRLNHANVFIERTGVFYGQCSEICGPNHGFMPIKVVAVDSNSYDNYLSKFLTYEVLGSLPALINHSAFDYQDFFEPNISQYPEDAVDFSERDKAALKFFSGEDGKSTFNIAKIKAIADMVDYQTGRIVVSIILKMFSE